MGDRGGLVGLGEVEGVGSSRGVGRGRKVTSDHWRWHAGGRHGYDSFFRFDSTQSHKILIPTQLMTHDGFPRIDSNHLTTRNCFLEFDSNRLKT